MKRPLNAGIDRYFDVTLPVHPYPGLRPFREDEWAIFFGREKVIDHVIGDLVEKRFVAIHGDSGSGKSSLVRAGVMPRLIQDLGRGGATWRAVAMEPGNAPMRNLAVALANLCPEGDEGAPTRFRRMLNFGREAAKELVKDLRRGETDHICILIDQFEETFAFAKGHNLAEAELFLEVLIGIQQKRLDGLHVILTMRSEYLGACARFAGLAEAINDSQYLLPPMNRQALVRAIREPASLYGGRVSLDLAEQLIIDAGASQDQLPLIQHGLMIMRSRLLSTPLERKAGGMSNSSNWELSLEDYRRTNGVVQLLSNHADEVLHDILTEHDDAGPLLEGVFRALTEIDSDGHAIRRRRTLTQLAEVVAVDAPALAAILGPLRADGVSFLRPYGDELLAEGDEISISHEALIRCWKRVADPATGWLRKEFEDGLIWKTLLVSADGFAADSSAVLPQTVTGERVRWLSGRNAAWATRYGGRFDDVRALLQASRHAIRRQKVRKLALLLTLCGALVLGLILGVNQMRNKQKLAIAEAEQAASREKLAIAEVRRALSDKELEIAKALRAESDNELAIARTQIALANAEDENLKLRSQLLAQKSTEITITGDAGTGLALALELLSGNSRLPYVAEAEQSVYAALLRLKERAVLTGHEKAVGSVAFSFDGRQVVTASFDGTARIWDVETGMLVKKLIGHNSFVNSAAFSPDGTQVLTASADSTARVWDAGSGTVVAELGGHDSVINSAAFSPDGTQVVIASADSTARVWNVGTETVVAVLIDHDSSVNSAEFSPDGTQVVTASFDGTARAWEVATGKLMAKLTGHEDTVLSVVFSPDGRQVVTASEDRTAVVWNVATGKLVAKFTGHVDTVLSAAFSPSGTQVVTASEDRTARVWDMQTGKLVAELRGHEGAVWSAAFSPDGTQVVTASEDRTARVWNVQTGTLVTELRGHEGAVWSAAFSPDGTQVVTASEDRTARIWSTRKALYGMSIRPSSINPDVKSTNREYGKTDRTETVSINTVDISPDGNRVLRRTGDKTYGIWRPLHDKNLFDNKQIDLNEYSIIATGFAGVQDVAILSSNRKRPIEFLIDGQYQTAPNTTNGVPYAVTFAPGQNRVAMYFSETSSLGFVELYDIREVPRLIARVQLANPTETTEIGKYRLIFYSNGDGIAGVSENSGLSGNGENMFTIDWPSTQNSTQPESEQPYQFTVETRELKRRPVLQKILGLHVDSDSFTVVRAQVMESANRQYELMLLDQARGNMPANFSLVVGNLLADDEFQTIRIGQDDRRPTWAGFSSDGERIALGSDQGVSLYSRAKGGMIGRFTISGKQSTATAFAANGTAIAATFVDGTIGYWPIFKTTEALVMFAEKVAPRRLTPEQVEAYLATSK